MGSLVVKTPDNIIFKIGSGFSDAERANPPKIGDTISFQYIGKTKNGVPRFASYLRIRNEI
jgi:DNA ligase-1